MYVWLLPNSSRKVLKVTTMQLLDQKLIQSGSYFKQVV